MPPAPLRRDDRRLHLPAAAVRATSFVFTLAALLLATLFTADALAQGNTIRIVHGSNAGAPQDIMLRLLADEMTKVGGQQVIVDPRPGANGQIAMGHLKQAPADGRTLLAEGTGITSILQLPDRQHEWTDFEPLYRVQLDPFALYALPKKYPDWKAMSQDMRTKPADVRVGGYAVGGPFQIVLMLISQKANGGFSWVPYDSGAKAITAVMGEHLEGAMSNISVYPQFREKTVVVAHTGESRLAQFPDIPTFRELGIDLVRYHWRGLFMKKGTPEPALDRMHGLVGSAVKSARFQQYLRESATIEGTLARPQFRDMIAEQARGDTQVLKQLKMLQ